MPDEQAWDSFFHPEDVLRRLGLTPQAGDVVEFGCGYGTFTLPAARITGGTVYALDIDPAMIAATQSKAEQAGLTNIQVHQCDFLAPKLPVPLGSAGYSMLFNILHAERPDVLIGRAREVLRKDGLLGIMHWNYDPNTPRGPSMEIRPRPEQCRDWAVAGGFELLPPGIVDLPPHHYGMVLRKVD